MSLLPVWMTNHTVSVYISSTINEEIIKWYFSISRIIQSTVWQFFSNNSFVNLTSHNRVALSSTIIKCIACFTTISFFVFTIIYYFVLAYLLAHVWILSKSSLRWSYIYNIICFEEIRGVWKKIALVSLPFGNFTHNALVGSNCSPNCISFKWPQFVTYQDFQYIP